MAPETLALIGMMGAGKTTVGNALSAQTGLPFLDSDAVIESEARMSVAEIFRSQGETAFRDWEAQVLSEALHREDSIIVGVAGGAILRAESRELLSAKSTVIWLKAPIETLIARVVHRHLDRPLIKDSPEETMRKLYEARLPIYEELARVTVDTDGRTPDVIAEEIIEKLK